MADVVATGEILVEIMATRVGQTFREPGLLAGPYPSGAPAIFADQAARVGASAAMVGCVGEDDFGTLNVERLGGRGGGGRALRGVRGAPTGIAFVPYPGDGGRDFTFPAASSAAAHLGPEHLDPGLFAGCRYFH